MVALNPEGGLHASAADSLDALAGPRFVEARESPLFIFFARPEGDVEIGIPVSQGLSLHFLAVTALRHPVEHG